MMIASKSSSARPSRDDTRDRILRAGCELIATRGYSNTGINAILQAADVPKGSFYYYFSSKEDFGLAVIADFDAHYCAKLDAVLDQAKLAPLTRIRRYFEDGTREMVAHDYGRGCLIGNLAQELAGQNDAFRLALDDVFQRWTRRFAACLEAAQAQGDIAPDADCAALAEYLLSGWEGALLRAKVTRTTAPMRDFATLFFTHVLRVAA